MKVKTLSKTLLKTSSSSSKIVLDHCFFLLKPVKPQRNTLHFKTVYNVNQLILTIKQLKKKGISDKKTPPFGSETNLSKKLVYSVLSVTSIDCLDCYEVINIFNSTTILCITRVG